MTASGTTTETATEATLPDSGLMEAFLSDEAAADSPLAISEAVEHRATPDKEDEVSPTALKLDRWSLARGEELLQTSELLQKVYSQEQEGATLTEERYQTAALEVADFCAAAYEPCPTLAEKCKNQKIQEYMRNLMETPEFKALHRQTQLDAEASEIAAASFAKQWLSIAKEGESATGNMMLMLGSASQALSEAREEVRSLHDARTALGTEFTDLFRRVKGSETLKRICEYAGRYRRFAQAQQRKKIIHGQDDSVGVVMGGDPSRLLPHELAMLGDQLLETEVMRRIVENQAMCREYRGIESRARGPIVVVVDESGSMIGDKIWTAKAMALALAWIARSQRRWCTLVGFSSGPIGTYCVCQADGTVKFVERTGKVKRGEEAPKWKYGPAGLIEWLEHTYGAGTTCHVPLVELPRMWDEIGAPKGKTDIICITDGAVSLTASQKRYFHAFKQREQVKMISLVLESHPGQMPEVSDRTHQVQTLSLEEDAVAEALSV